jgi:hypothetical protein|nr:MAG TPA: hypothetical protein [Caudoviricetes sp.]
MNENNIIRLYDYLKNNYQRFYKNSIHYSYVCSSARFHYFVQCTLQEFKIKAVNKANKSDVIIYRFSDHNELITLLNTKPLLKAVFANIVKQLSYYSYIILNRVRPSETNVDNSFYIAITNDIERYKNQHSDYLNRQENTIIGSLSNDQVVSFSNARNIFINDRVERVQLSAQNLMTEQRVREIVQQAFRERISELRDRMNITATDHRVEQSLRELSHRVEELSRRFDRRRNPEQR